LSYRGATPTRLPVAAWAKSPAPPLLSLRPEKRFFPPYAEALIAFENFRLTWPRRLNQNIIAGG
jgi:hypothetical protein